jgi:hypothetical protein
VYAEEFRDPNEAIAAEKRIKGWNRRKKQALIRGDFDEIVRLARERRRPSIPQGGSIPHHDMGAHHNNG